MKSIYIKSFIIILGIALLTSPVVGAQSKKSAQDKLNLPINDIQTNVIGDELEISFDLKLDTLELPSNRFVRFVPVIVGGDSISLLKSFIIAGRRQFIMRGRKETELSLVKRKNGKEQTYEYYCRFPYEKWMNGAELKLTQDICGCGGWSLLQHQTDMTTLKLENKEYIITPSLAFVKPQVEVVKTRSESGKAFLDFPVNETVIYPDYRQNRSELQKITHTIDLVKNDEKTTITHIHIHGYASPEGSFAKNKRLAQGRAEALKQYVRQLYHFEDSVLSVESTPEDWEGLEKWVAGSEIKHKEEIERIVKSHLDADARNEALKRVANGAIYAKLLRDVYPTLRHSDYTVTFTVRAFDIDEAKQLVNTRPQLLSLEEMFAVASTYEPGSKEFNEVFDIAVRMFPENETANLNAAMVALGDGEYKRAGNYLSKSGTSPEALLARGLLSMMTGRYDEAKIYLEEAENLGVEQASENLRQLNEKLNSLK